MYAIVFNKFRREEKRQKKKSQNAGQLGRKRSRQITIGHKMSRVRIWTFVKLLTFCVTIGHTDSVLVPAKQTKQQHAQAAETNLTRMCSSTASTESATKTTQKTAETMKHTQASSTKLKQLPSRNRNTHNKNPSKLRNKHS